MTIHKIKKCKKVIANSPHTKNQIQKYFKISEDKIQIIYEAFDTDLFFVQEKKASTKQLICNTFGITYPYLLYISSFRPYKNHKLLLDAFKKVKSKKQIPHSLVLIGNDINDYKSEIERYVSKLELNDNVKFIDFIHHWDLPSVYNYADLFVYPSEYETFGIPPLESMACGTPVIASNKSCIPEICGPGAVIVDPYDSTTFSNEIFRLLSDKEHRLSLINKGLNHCKKYSWRENVAQTLQIINEFTNTIRNERYSKSN
jgi:glycosyltransferase involved in cell wall biosynthesis